MQYERTCHSTMNAVHLGVFLLVSQISSASRWDPSMGKGGVNIYIRHKLQHMQDNDRLVTPLRDQMAWMRDSTLNTRRNSWHDSLHFYLPYLHILTHDRRLQHHPNAGTVGGGHHALLLQLCIVWGNWKGWDADFAGWFVITTSLFLLSISFNVMRQEQHHNSQWSLISARY